MCVWGAGGGGIMIRDRERDGSRKVKQIERERGRE